GAPGAPAGPPRARVSCAPALPSRVARNRGIPMRSLSASLLAAALALATFAPAAYAAEINWRDWNTGLAEAAASKRPVVVDVYTDWCGWCKRMEKDVYAREDVRD